MAFLIPLLAPVVAEVVGNIGLGLANASQADSSNFSIQIGNKVFTTNKGFPLTQLPYELRELILLMALEESRSLVAPPPILLHPAQPLSQAQLTAVQRRSFLHPSNPQYRSLVAEAKSANGYPISSWRWLKVGREWWAILRRELWKDTTVSGFEPYLNFLKLVDSPEFHCLPFIEKLALLDGFQSPSDLYTIIRSPRLKNLTSLSLLPTFPTPSHPFSPVPRLFAMSLAMVPAPTPRTITAFTLGMPLDLVTNSSTRQQLQTLALRSLGVTVSRPTSTFFTELHDLVGTTIETLSVRYFPDTTRPFAAPDVFLSPALTLVPRLVLYLPRILSSPRLPYDGRPDDKTSFAQRLVDLLALEDGMRDSTEVWLVAGMFGPAMADAGEPDERIWPVSGAAVEEEAEEELRAITRGMEGSSIGSGDKGTAEKGREKGKGKEVAKAAATKTSDETWERQTNLSLFGFHIRMESKKNK